jgi:glyoxylase-like metal-dependent hydrolase (beta-lactamase superfamily II)
MKQIFSKIFQIGLGSVNVFLIEDNGLTLVDTGLNNSTDKIFAAIRKGGRNPDDIRQIILTHAHPDHSGSAGEIQRRLGIPVMAHVDDAHILEQGIGGREPRILTPGVINFIAYHLFIKNSSPDVEPPIIERKLTDGDVIDISGGIQVIHVPGHSLGQVALLVKDEGVLIAGDLCANFFGLALSPVHEDPALAVESIGKVASFHFDKAVFGHGSPIMKDADTAIRGFYEEVKIAK